MEPWQERTSMMIGEDGLSRLAASSVAVVGLGGVGGAAAEMLVRAGVGRMLILDSDTVSLTNKNRQLAALDSTLGQPKTEVVASRLKDINPKLDLIIVAEYLTEDNIAQLIEPFRPDYLVDAIDTLAPKLALIRWCVGQGIPLVSSMGAGAKRDLTRVRIADISKTFNCPLAHFVRKKLRRSGIHRGFKAVFSEELPDEKSIVLMDKEEQASTRNKKSQAGTLSYLPVVFGCACAQAAIEHLISRQQP